MKQCIFCNSDFEPNKPKQKFCSAKCRVYFNREEDYEGGFVYALRNPLDDGNIFYVGKTIVPLNKRLSGHLNEVNKNNNKKCSIIKSILAANQEVIIEQIEFISGEESKSIIEIEKKLSEREIFWIKEFSKRYDITNQTYNDYATENYDSNGAVIKNFNPLCIPILDWFKEHSLISPLRIGEIVGIKKPNFYLYIKTKSIPQKYIQPIIEVLKKYGYEDKSALQNVVGSKNIIAPITIKIYHLKNPIDNSVFYVGRTIGTLDGRLKAHIKEIEDGSVSKKREILKFILSEKQLPIITEIESYECNCQSDELKINEREQYWIEFYSNTVCNVVGIKQVYKNKAVIKNYSNSIVDDFILQSAQNINPQAEVENQNKTISDPIIENAVDDTKEEKEVSTEQVNSFIERITAIQKETLPPDIKTPFGKKVWLNDQRKKIEAIREEINKAV